VTFDGSVLSYNLYNENCDHLVQLSYLMCGAVLSHMMLSSSGSLFVVCKTGPHF